jgi:hypothetical protein
MQDYAAEILVFDGLVDVVAKCNPGDILSIPCLTAKERPDSSLVREGNRRSFHSTCNNYTHASLGLSRASTALPPFRPW